MKRLLLSASYIIFSLQLFGQSLKELNEQFIEYGKQGNYEKAILLGEKAVERAKKELGDEAPGYATLLYNLAGVYGKAVQYSRAETLLLQAIVIQFKTEGENSPVFIKSVQTLAFLYYQMGQFEKGEKPFLSVINFYKGTKQEDNPEYLTSLTGLANLYTAIGQYQKAKTMFNEIIEKKKKIYGEESKEYASGLAGLAELYFKTGLYNESEKAMLTIMEIMKKLSGKQSQEYAASLNNLSSLYNRLGKFKKSDSLLILSQEITRKNLGEKNLSYATVLSNRALSNKGMLRLEVAEQLYLRSANITKDILGENHPEHAFSLSNLAQVYMEMSRYTKAENLFIQSLAILKILGENHPQHIAGIGNLADLYETSGQYSKAEPLIMLKNRLAGQNLLNAFTVLSDEEKLTYMVNTISILETNNSFLYRYKNASAEFLENSFGMLLILKSLSLADTKQVIVAGRESGDSVLLELLNQWEAQKYILAKQYGLPVGARRSDIKEIQNQTEQLEKEINRRSAAFRNQRMALQVSMQDIQYNMMEDEVAIEFVRFRLYNKKWTDSVMYAAYVLHKNDPAPRFVPLCEEKKLIKILSQVGSSAGTIKAVYRSEIAGGEDQKIELGDSLYVLIWKPLLPFLKGIKKVNYSPAGLLNKIAFHALPAGSNQLLLDQYQLRQFTGIRQLAEESEDSKKANSITLFGDCTFTMDSTLMANSNSNLKVSNFFTPPVADRGSGSWKNLPGTAEELKHIRALFENNQISTVVYSQQDATEEKFKSLAGNSTSIIHLATHGFFLTDPVQSKQQRGLNDDRNVFSMAEDPLMRSGVVLSGANRAWSGQYPIEGREDGIVTAYEISQLDLHKTELVVLSACETALGDIRGNEGVFGLQRAFKLAGVKNLLLSLWRVPDAETAELMTSFYTYYIQGKPVREAFTSAQKDMRAKYKPYYWAAFVLIE